MRIKYLGTAAFEGVPALFCNCRVCQSAKKLGGRNLRSRSQALINDELLIEFNPDTVWHYHTYCFDWKKILGCLITHSHSDHLYPADIEMAASCFTHAHKPLHFYSARSGYDKIKAMSDAIGEGVEVTLIVAGNRFSVGEYDVLPLWANHSEETSPVIYSIGYKGKKILYAHDTGVFSEKTWELLKNERRFDLISLDCTGCLAKGGDWVDGHMSFGTDLKTADRMRNEGLIDGKTLIVLNHFSHNGGQTYDEMRVEAEKAGVIVSYDGLEIEF